MRLLQVQAPLLLPLSALRRAGLQFFGTMRRVVGPWMGLLSGSCDVRQRAAWLALGFVPRRRMQPPGHFEFVCLA